MARLVCLANSERPGGQCIAGIDLATGQWIRPVAREADALRIHRCIVGGKLLTPLDVLELDVDPLPEIPHFQRENRLIKNWNWAITGQLSKADLLAHCDETAPILHGVGARVPVEALAMLPAEQWQSLQLVRARDLRCEHAYHDMHRWRIRFQDGVGNVYRLPITDGAIRGRLQGGETLRRDSLLTVSLTKPWAPPDGSKPEFCYKVVAAVVEL